jgi:predicted nucleic acid-binding protein
MAYLIDTNCLLRYAQPQHALNALMHTAFRALQDRGEEVYVTPQNLIEFWNVATRPLDRNGFGMTPAQADQEATRLESLFRLAPDAPTIYSQWRQIVVAVAVSGVQVHDARLVAVMRVHGLTHILTLNTTDFTRYPDVTVVHPQDVAGGPPPAAPAPP